MESITISKVVNAPIERVWECRTRPEHIMERNHASGDRHCPKATNDLIPGGEFVYTMAAKDGSTSFDFWWTYDQVIEHTLISATMGDGRKMKVTFEVQDGGVLVTETFDPEGTNSVYKQQSGRQAILDNFKTHTESH